MAQTENIIVCNSVAEFNERLSNARPKNSVVIAGMYNSLVDRILIGDKKNQGKVKEIYLSISRFYFILRWPLILILFT